MIEIEVYKKNKNRAIKKRYFLDIIYEKKNSNSWSNWILGY